MRHTNWRDCKEWKTLGFEFSTTSNEAVKLYDATISQLMGMYDEPSVGGLEASISNLIESDPNWVMGHAMRNGLILLANDQDPANEKMQRLMDTMNLLVEGPNVSYTERLHVKACRAFAERNLDRACDIWDSILMVQPLDMWALRCLYTSYIYLGYSNQLRDIIARVLPSWTENIPLYGYLNGLYAFGLNETNYHDEAAKYARKALDVNSLDVWATHSMAHVYEMQGRSSEGIKFMLATENDWTSGGMLACHNYWHLGVYHIEQGQHEEALDIFDSQLIRRAKSSHSLFNTSDVSALLFRLRLEGVDVSKRWADVHELCTPHFDDNTLAFNYPHFMFSSIGTADDESISKLLKSIQCFIRDGFGTTHRIAKDVGQAICQSLGAYYEENFSQAVEILYPVRYKIWQIGGSHAQRDVLNLFLIHCASKSPNKDHQTFARQLLHERLANKKSSPMSERLLEKLVQSH